MKKLIIGIGFTALMAVMGLQAGGLSPEALAMATKQVVVLETWLKEKPQSRKLTPTLVTNLKTFLLCAEGREIFAKNPLVNAQLQQAQNSLTSQEQVLKEVAKDEKRMAAKVAAQACAQELKKRHPSPIKGFKTLISRVAKLAGLAVGTFLVYREVNKPTAPTWTYNTAGYANGTDITYAYINSPAYNQQMSLQNMSFPQAVASVATTTTPLLITSPMVQTADIIPAAKCWTASEACQADVDAATAALETADDEQAQAKHNLQSATAAYGQAWKAYASDCMANVPWYKKCPIIKLLFSEAVNDCGDAFIVNAPHVKQCTAAQKSFGNTTTVYNTAYDKLNAVKTRCASVLGSPTTENIGTESAASTTLDPAYNPCVKAAYARLQEAQEKLDRTPTLRQTSYSQALGSSETIINDRRAAQAAVMKAQQDYDAALQQCTH
ncbi:MAG: hypothetical protein WC365_04505 [Candidatus Babeliales bacterium]|jgi:hypothetical protein